MKLLLQRLHAAFLPWKVVLFADGADGQRLLGERLEFVRGLKPIDGKATAFVCENFVCQLPTADPALFERQLTAAARPQP